MAEQPPVEALRTFLALPLADVFSSEIEQFLSELRRLNEPVKWVQPDQVHVTLHFFGKTWPGELETIHAIAVKRSGRYPPLRIGLEGLGAFPKMSRPSILWLPVSGRGEKLEYLQAGIEKDLARAGFPVEERRFKPHATVGRVRRGRHLSDGLELPRMARTEEREIKRLVLYKSTLTPQGSLYEIVEEFPLTGKA